MWHTHRYHLMIHISKISLISISVILMLAVLIWPYLHESHRYNIVDRPTSEVAPTETTESRAEIEAPSSTPRSSQTVKEGSMRFQGRTQVIICPEQSPS